MNTIITNKQNEINQLCEKYHVKKLEAFGSVVRADFNSEQSDIDFLVEFSDLAFENYADNFFGLLSSLEVLLKAPVDLLVISGIKNPYFLESIEADRQFLYAA